MSVREEVEDVLEGVVYVYDTGQGVGEVIERCLCGTGSGGGQDGGEVVDVVLDVGDERVRSAGKTYGPDVVGHLGFL